MYVCMNVCMFVLTYGRKYVFIQPIKDIISTHTFFKAFEEGGEFSQWLKARDQLYGSRLSGGGDGGVEAGALGAI